jgi:phosphoribosylanthranilate isomerase
LFRLKICGITNPDDALHALGQGVDALGLNFYSRSSRYVSPESAQQIVSTVATSDLAPQAKIGGVFVNEPEASWSNCLATSGIHFTQFHGDEPPPRIASAKLKHPVVKAFRCQGTNLAEVRRYLEACRASGALPDAILLDAYSPTAYGGTGAVIDWHAVREQRDQLLGLPIILAGGLTPDNVAEAIRTAHPDGVDVASGVEQSPGKKDPAKVRDFLAAARGAFAELAHST